MSRRSTTSHRGFRTGSRLLVGVTLASTLALLTGCPAEPTPAADPAPVANRFQLVAFDSCTDALRQLRSAAREYVGPWGFTSGQGRAIDLAVPEGASEKEATSPDSQPAPGYSGTNSHETGVDEPDLVKTDGRRIVLVSRGILTVIDPATRRITGRLALPPGQSYGGWQESNLLLYGDRALILRHEQSRILEQSGGVRDQSGDVREGVAPDRAPAGPVPPRDDAIVGPRLILVDLTGPPTVLSEYRMDGALIDARQVGATVRVVVRSAPRLSFPYRERATDAERLAENRRIVDRADVTAWLPRYEVSTAGRTSTGQVGCERFSRPASYSGATMLTLLSFDLGAAALDSGDPVTVLADGETVYSNGRHLYLASDQRWKQIQVPSFDKPAPRTQDESTELHQFDISGPGRPRYVTTTSVPGWLVNQYAISEWDGHLRVATTTGGDRFGGTGSSSAVYVLRADDRTLAETGRVTGLGKGERIYSVRFTGPTGYVVTFRQTDPLYTVDLRDPATPRITGELKITGYSAYLHPVGDDRLLGIGQEASTQGRVQGTQISLFDVADPEHPTRLARHHVRRSHSEAEFDPHAFLYWPAEQLLVVPLASYYDPGQPTPVDGALVLRVTDRGFTELGLLNHRRAGDQTPPGMIRRTLVVNGVLWSVSENAVAATEIATMRTLRLLEI